MKIISLLPRPLQCNLFFVAELEESAFVLLLLMDQVSSFDLLAIDYHQPWQFEIELTIQIL